MPRPFHSGLSLDIPDRRGTGGILVRVCENGLAITSKAATTAETGVEMEALVAVSVCALTLYDMLKGADKSIEIRQIVLERKSGGKSGEYRRGR